jgi:hypothetical protein
MTRPDSARMPIEHHGDGRPVCPVCQGDVARIARRWSDRLWSYFVPVHRYRCEHCHCGWVGNLRVFPSTPPAIAMPEHGPRGES